MLRMRLRLLGMSLFLSVMLIGQVVVSAEASSGASVDVRLTRSGPWIAELVNVDLATVRSATYYVKDAKDHWTRLDPVTSVPFEAPVEWWQGDNSGFIAVTAHVTLKTGKTIKDPGGWHWVDGHHADPKGTIAAWVNSDGTPGASYTPDQHFADIKAVEFWFRDGDNQWHNAGQIVREPEDTDWVLLSYTAAGKAWQGSSAAMSVHVIWPTDRQLVDPANWATNFTPAPESSTAPTSANQPALSASCGDPHAHVYSPDRLQLLAPCVTVTGVVDAVRSERDGDYHVLLRLDPGEEKYLNAKNASELGDLVLEPVCEVTVTQADAIAACAGYSNPLRVPPVGSRISVTGPWVLDRDHGWQEIHPVFAFNEVGAPSTAPPATATPTAAPPPPPPATPVPTAAPPPAPAVNLCGAPANPWNYNLCGGNLITSPASGICGYFSCIASFWNGTGYVVQCADGTYSKSGGHIGVCSYHGGFARNLYSP